MPADSEDRDRHLQSKLGVEAAALDALRDALHASYSVNEWGFARYASLPDQRARAISSDMVLSSADAVAVAAREMALHERAFARLLGPNGRTVPGPHTSDEQYAEFHELQMHGVGALRAFGSALDCLTAVAIGVTGARISIHAASATAMFQPLTVSSDAPQGQIEATSQVSSVIAAAIAEPPAGWAQWALEMRNSVVHRARLLQTWLSQPGRQPGQPQLLVQTEQPLASLVRAEPHFRRTPWLPDMDALAAPHPVTGLWLAEPIQVTLEGLRRRLVLMMDRVGQALLEIWQQDSSGWVWPAQAWSAGPHPSARLNAAAAFVGFEPQYPVPPPGFLAMHPRSARRAELAERLRREGQRQL
jgi:hypothetical protein